MCVSQMSVIWFSLGAQLQDFWWHWVVWASHRGGCTHFFDPYLFGSCSVGGFHVVFMVPRPGNSTTRGVSGNCFSDVFAGCSGASVLENWNSRIGPSWQVTVASKPLFFCSNMVLVGAPFLCLFWGGSRIGVNGFEMGCKNRKILFSCSREGLPATWMVSRLFALS